MFKLASLFVEIKAEDSALQRQLGGIQKQLGVMGVAMGSALGTGILGIIDKAIGAVAEFVSKGISGAANLGESLSKVGVTFGGSASLITGLADDMAKKFGTVKGVVLEAASNYGQITKGAGFAADESARLSRDLVKLADDASSFHNVGIDVALEKIRAGLTGESEPLKAFGVLMTEDAVKAEALALGLVRNSKEMDDHAKMVARASIITRGLKDVQGDHEKTLDSSTNQWRKLTGTLQNVATTIGESLSPVTDFVMGQLGSMTAAISGWVEANKGRFKEFAEATVRVFRVDIPNAWDTFIAGLAVASYKAEEFGHNTMAVFATIPENLSRIGNYIANNWREMITDAVNAVVAVFKNLGDNLYELGAALARFLRDPTGGIDFHWKPLLDGFKATADQLPELLKPALVSMDAQIAAVGENLAKQTAARVKAVEAAGKAAAAPGKAAAAAAAAKSTDFKSVLSGASEFALKMRASIYESGNKIPEQQLAAQNRTALASETTAAKVGAMAFTRLK